MTTPSPQVFSASAGAAEVQQVALEWEEEAAGKMQHQLEAFREEASGRCTGAVARTQQLQQTELALGSSLLFILREIGWSLTSARGFCPAAWREPFYLLESQRYWTASLEGCNLPPVFTFNALLWVVFLSDQELVTLLTLEHTVQPVFAIPPPLGNPPV